MCVVEEDRESLNYCYGRPKMTPVDKKIREKYDVTKNCHTAKKLKIKLTNIRRWYLCLEYMY